MILPGSNLTECSIPPGWTNVTDDAGLPDIRRAGIAGVGERSGVDSFLHLTMNRIIVIGKIKIMFWVIFLFSVFLI